MCVFGQQIGSWGGGKASPSPHSAVAGGKAKGRPDQDQVRVYYPVAGTRVQVVAKGADAICKGGPRPPDQARVKGKGKGKASSHPFSEHLYFNSYHDAYYTSVFPEMQAGGSGLSWKFMGAARFLAAASPRVAARTPPSFMVLLLMV